MFPLVNISDSQLTIRRIALWSPIATRFSPLEVCALLGASRAELRFIGSIDSNALPSIDVDDPSVRSGYYNFWGIARIALHRRVRVFLRSDSVVDEWVGRIEDELQEFLEAEFDGQVHFEAVERFGRSILQSPHASLSLVASRAEQASVTEIWIRYCYVGETIDVSKCIASLLLEEGGSDLVTSDERDGTLDPGHQRTDRIRCPEISKS